MRIVFAGTPASAVPALDAIAASRHDLVGVLTRPDAPSGRGRDPKPSPVARRGRELGIPVLTPDTLRGEEALAPLAALEPDAVAVVAYGLLIPEPALTLPRHGWINLHYSLLPRHRGAAPVQAAILAGDRETGATTFRIAKGLDTGDILGSVSTEIGQDEVAGTLLDRLTALGAPLLESTLDALEDGTAIAVPQDDSRATHVGKFTPADAELDWNLTAEQLSRRVRAFTPKPGAWTLLDGERVKILGLSPIAPSLPPAGGDPGDSGPAGTAGTELLVPGALRAGKHAVQVGTGSGAAELTVVAPEGRKAMNAADWARGKRIAAGTRFDRAVPAQDTAKEAAHE